MKTLLRLHALIFCVFLFALTTTSLVQDVLDEGGDPLYNGGLYYIIPALRGQGGGGLELAKTGSETCPLTVAQAPSEASRGIPAKLSTPPLILTLATGFYLNIEFEVQKQPTCLPYRTQWKVEEESQTVKIAYLEEWQLFGPFQIQPHGDNYKIVYCGRDDSQGNGECKDLGISIDDENNRRLVVKDGDPLVVKFVKPNRRGGSTRMTIV